MQLLSRSMEKSIRRTGGITILALVAAATMLIPLSAIGSTQQASAATVRTVRGNGEGHLFCAPGTVVPSPPGGDTSIGFLAQKQKGKISGFWSIDINGPGVFFSKEGVITGGSISSNSFTLTGQETSDTACLTGASATNPISITITGQCGTNVPITFKSAAFQEGHFTGSVSCTS